MKQLRTVGMSCLLALAGAAAVAASCEANHVDLNYGNEAGADFVAPPREVGGDTGDAAADAGADVALPSTAAQ
jgi:hypothetical protein